MRGWTLADEAIAACLAGERLVQLYKYCERGPSSRDRLPAAVTRSALPVPTYADLKDPFDGCAPFDFDADDRTLRHYWGGRGPPAPGGHRGARARLSTRIARRAGSI